MTEYLRPGRAMGQVQKFADRWIITGLEITTRETMHAFSLENLLLRHKSFSICALFSNNFTSGQSQDPDLHSES